MRYSVRWVPDAEQELAAIWVDAPDRRAVSQAADRIDELLRSDPEDRGESRPHDRRVLIEPPLGVIYKVDPGDRIVSVLTVWGFVTGSSSDRGYGEA